jgi:hypothetical protein
MGKARALVVVSIGLVVFGLVPNAGAPFVYDASYQAANGVLLADGTSPGLENFFVEDAETPFSGQDDAYDGVYILDVDGTTFEDADEFIDQKGDTFRAGPVPIAGLDVSGSIHLDKQLPVIRWLYRFKNPSNSTITATATLDFDLGSDNSTVVQGSSDNDAVAESTDTWIVTSEGAGPAFPDPVLLHIRGDQNQGILTGGPADTDADYTEVFSLSVPAGKTKSIMLLSWLNQDDEDALGFGPLVDSSKDLAKRGLLDGISAGVARSVINWNKLASFV